MPDLLTLPRQRTVLRGTYNILLDAKNPDSSYELKADKKALGL